MYGIQSIKSCLKTAQRPAACEAGRRAAVALILRPATPSDCSLLLIQRAEDPRDPWSGQVGLPGGHVDVTDAGPEAAVLRETREELALDLTTHAAHLGRLQPAITDAGGRTAPVSVLPFVFELTRPAALRPNHEVQRAVWVSLAALRDPLSASTFTHEGPARPAVFPCLWVDGLKIWGLTLRIIDDFFWQATTHR